jgi:hypothetical protein
VCADAAAAVPTGQVELLVRVPAGSTPGNADFIAQIAAIAGVPVADVTINATRLAGTASDVYIIVVQFGGSNPAAAANAVVSAVRTGEASVNAAGVQSARQGSDPAVDYTPPGGSSNGLPSGAVAGIAIGAVVVAGAIGFAAFSYARARSTSLIAGARAPPLPPSHACDR